MESIGTIGTMYRDYRVYIGGLYRDKKIYNGNYYNCNYRGYIVSN